MLGDGRRQEPHPYLLNGDLGDILPEAVSCERARIVPPDGPLYTSSASTMLAPAGDEIDPLEPFGEEFPEITSLVMKETCGLFTADLSSSSKDTDLVPVPFLTGDRAPLSLAAAEEVDVLIIGDCGTIPLSADGGLFCGRTAGAEAGLPPLF
jgi:hypothetical protein